jgi:hypothetical protein
MKRVIIPSVLFIGLTLGACNTNTRTREHTERSNDNKTEIKDRKSTDSTEYKRDKTIKYDDQGNVKESTEKVKTDKDRNNDNTNPNSTNRSNTNKR